MVEHVAQVRPRGVVEEPVLVAHEHRDRVARGERVALEEAQFAPQVVEVADERRRRPLDGDVLDALHPVREPLDLAEDRVHARVDQADTR